MPPPERDNRLTYRDAGVDIDRGRRLVERIGPLAASTRRPEVIGGIGGFGALFEVPEGYRRPVLVSGADGVGTKLAIAIEQARHESVGMDLVAMCVNDVLSAGAEPLYFLDYFATARIDEDVAAEVLRGIAEGCRIAGAALIGGESAEMPGMYAEGDYDLAGFCVGIVERDRIIDGSRVAPGDALVGLASSGLHANGYSLVRRVLELSGWRLHQKFGERTLGDTLLEATRIYVPSVLDLIRHVEVRGIAHITGGGLVENVPRLLSAPCVARIHPRAWPRDPVFEWLAEEGGISEDEMRRTFNCGIGLVAAVAAEDLDTALRRLRDSGERPFVIGEVVPATSPDAPRIEFE